VDAPHFQNTETQRLAFAHKSLYVMRPNDYTPHQLYKVNSISELMPPSVPASKILLPAHAPVISGYWMLGLLPNRFEAAGKYETLLSPEKVKVYIVSHNQQTLEQFEGWPGYVTVNLSTLPIGKYQSNQFSESRIFLSDIIEETRGDADYIAIVSARYDDKYVSTVKTVRTRLHALHFTLRYLSAPDRVLSPSIASRQWVTDMVFYFPSLIQPMQEISEHFKIPLYTGRPTVLCNNYCAHIDVYRHHNTKFREWFNYLYDKYGEIFPFRWEHIDTSRASGYICERLTELFFANTDYDILHLP
jgi:hypothetical protein